MLTKELCVAGELEQPHVKSKLRQYSFQLPFKLSCIISYRPGGLFGILET